MEIAETVLNLASAPIARCLTYHSEIYPNTDTLIHKIEELNCRKRDIESRLIIELVAGETMVKSEVENWLKRAEKNIREATIIVAKVTKSNFLSRARLGRKVFKQIFAVEETYENGDFPDGLVFVMPRRGDKLPTTSPLGGETTFKRKIEEIWESLVSDEVSKIGVYGMGGIGKTTALELINNRVLERNDKFNYVIWVTVSRTQDGADSILNLQEKIARKLDLVILSDDDQITRAAKILGQLKRKGRFVLILDDLWEAEYSLKDVGIPEPTSENGCKLVVATRSIEVCHRLNCKKIEMALLAKDEAMGLFLDVVGPSARFVVYAGAIVKEIVRECAGLPLAIVMVARSLKGSLDYDEWVIALEELRNSTKGSPYSGVYERLRSSYDCLNSDRLKDCLLYCALYPEGHEIRRDVLIERLIIEGLVEKCETRQLQIRKGNVMLNKLVNACLLSSTTKSSGINYVKMHKLIRDMAIHVSYESPQKFTPSEEHLKDGLQKASSRVEPLKCQLGAFSSLKTLFLHECHKIEKLFAVESLSSTDKFMVDESEKLKESILTKSEDHHHSPMVKITTIPKLAKLVLRSPRSNKH